VAEKAHILILEDQPETQVLLQKQLGAAGYRVTIATDGLQGLMQLEKIKPDLIIIDILMPKLNGLDFARAIRSQAATRTIPTIFLTAKDDPQSMVDGINAGARYYITKPFDMADLIKKVGKILQGPRRG
jgi:two-component system, chemotaxis family, chemotaxis protein CheY